LNLNKKMKFLVILVLTISLISPSLTNASSLIKESNEFQYLNEETLDIHTNGSQEYSDEEILNMSIEILKNNGYSKKEIDVMLEEVVEIQDYFVFNENSNIFFDSDQAIKEGVDKELVLRTKADMEMLGEEINLLASCPGISGWYEAQSVFFFDSCQTSEMVYWITTGANLSTIAGLITAYFNPAAGLPVAIAGVLINQGAAYINRIDRGYGFSVFYNRRPIEFHGQ